MARTLIRDRCYLDWLRTQRCIISGSFESPDDPVEAAHVGTLGKSIKSPDDEALPLKHSLHAASHQMGEMSFYRKHASDALLRAALRALAREMYEEWKKSSSSLP